MNIRVRVEGEAPSFALPHLDSADLVPPAIRQVKLYGLAQPVNMYSRDVLRATQQLLGPALIVEKVSTTYVAESWTCQLDALGNLLLDKH